MANLENRLTQNVPGRFYVDDSCIDCDQCRFNVPSSFRRDDDLGSSVVFRQPETPEEIALAEEAAEGCPSSSIGSDGPSVA